MPRGEGNKQRKYQRKIDISIAIRNVIDCSLIWREAISHGSATDIAAHQDRLVIAVEEYRRHMTKDVVNT